MYDQSMRNVVISIIAAVMFSIIAAVQLGMLGKEVFDFIALILVFCWAKASINSAMADHRAQSAKDQAEMLIAAKEQEIEVLQQKINALK